MYSFVMIICIPWRFQIYRAGLVTSQNYRMAKVERDPWRSSSPVSLITWGRLEHITRDCVQTAFKYLQGKSPLPLCATVPVLCHPYWKEYLMLIWNFLCCSLCPLRLILSLGTYEKSLAQSSWHPPFRYLYALIRFPLSLLFSSLNRLNSLSIFSFERCSTPLIILVALCWSQSRSSKSLSY